MNKNGVLTTNNGKLHRCRNYLSINKVLFLFIGMLVHRKESFQFVLSFQQQHHQQHHQYDDHRRCRRHNHLVTKDCGFESSSSSLLGSTARSKGIVTIPTLTSSIQLNLSLDYSDEVNSLALWDQMFDLLTSYQQREKHSNVPRKHKEEGKNLGYWVNTQREYKRLGKLNDERIHRLTDLGFTFDVKKHKWEKMLALLVQYKDREGHCRVPESHKEDDETLGVWLTRQLTAKRNGKLNKEYQRRLEEVGAELNMTHHEQKWENMFTLLVQYVEREGHCNIPQKHNENGKQLGNWIYNQRSKKRYGKLSDDYQRRMEKLGVVWVIRERSGKNWDEMYELLVQFNIREGHCRIVQGHKEDDESLGKWLKTQRLMIRKEELSDERCNQLYKLGVALDPLSQRWDYMYSLLINYKELEGDCNVLGNYKINDQPLGKWLQTQRSHIRKGKLDTNQQRQLEELGVDWKIIK